MILWEKIESDPELTFEINTTLADHLAFSRYFRRLPERRRHQLNLIVGYGLLVPLIALVACFALLLVLRGSGCDLDVALGDDGRARFYGVVLASIAGGEALAWLALALWRRAGTEATLRAQLARRPGIDRADPTLAERNVVTLHAAGFRVATDAAAWASSWTTTRHFDEAADHFFIMAETNLGFIVPKRDLPPPTVLALRDMMLAFRKAKHP